MVARRSASSSALCACVVTRGTSVRSPRSKQPRLERPEDCAVPDAHRLIRSQASKGGPPASAPAITSEWPLEIFRRRMHHDVGAEPQWLREHRRCDVRIDASKDAGRVRDLGDRAMSLIDQSGFPASPHRQRGRRRHGGAQRRRVVVSTNATWWPKRCASLASQCRNAQYITCEATMRGGLRQRQHDAVAAAMPTRTAPLRARLRARDYGFGLRTVALSGRPYA